MTRGLETLFPIFITVYISIFSIQYSQVHNFTVIDQKVNRYFTGCKLQILQMHVTAIVFSSHAIHKYDLLYNN